MSQVEHQSQARSLLSLVGRLFLAVAAVVGGAACVTSGNYDAVYADLTEAKRLQRSNASTCEEEQANLRARTEELAAREEALSASEAELKQMLLTTSAALEAAQKKGEITEAEKNELLARQAEMSRQVQEHQQLLEQFRAMVDAGDLQVKVEGGRMVLALPSDIMFASASAELSEHGVETLQQVAGVLKGVRGRNFQVEGHTDALPIKTEEFPSNWHLAAARALVVLDAMIAAGLPAQRLSAASLAEHRPVRNNRTAAGRAANRRIEIVLLPDVSKVIGKTPK